MAGEISVNKMSSMVLFIKNYAVILIAIVHIETDVFGLRTYVIMQLLGLRKGGDELL